MKNFTLKKIILCSIAFLAALLTVLALCFNLVYVKANVFGNKIVEGDNGFALLDFDSMFILDKNSFGWGSSFIGVLCYLQLIAGIGGMALIAVALFVFKAKSAKTCGIIVVILSFSFAILYLLEGLFFSTIVNTTSRLSTRTLSFVPLILIALVGVAYFVCAYLLPENGKTKLQADDSIGRRKTTSRDEKTVAEALIKYKELLDSGIITQEEFEKKKSEMI